MLSGVALNPKKYLAKKEKVIIEPSETYLCFSAFASTYERLAGVTYPSDKGNYIMTAKRWCKTVKN